jgi:2-oxoglutarate ferredoxin oxidoreductase subunit alpha
MDIIPFINEWRDVMKLVIKVGAQAGQGAFVTGRTLCHIFAKLGFDVFGYPEYPSLVRGGHNSYQIVVSDEGIFSPLEESDILLAINKDAIKFHLNSLKQGGFVISDKTINVAREDVHHIALSVSDIIKEAKGNEKMKNVALISATLALCGIDLKLLNEMIESTFAKKGEDIVRANKDVARLAYDKVDERINLDMPEEGKSKDIATGNELIAFGAVKGGLGFYAAYPMTPATGVLHALIRDEEKHDIVVLQAEDEIAAANMAVGAAFAGARAMVGTSGGGFALMTEALSFAVQAEFPITVVLAQRAQVKIPIFNLTTKK